MLACDDRVTGCNVKFTVHNPFQAFSLFIHCNIFSFLLQTFCYYIKKF